MAHTLSGIILCFRNQLGTQHSQVAKPPDEQTFQFFFIIKCIISEYILVFFQNKGIFIHLDEIDEFDKITHALIRLNLQFPIKAKHYSVMFRVADCCASNLGSIPGKFFATFYRPHSEGMGKVLFSQVSVCPHSGWGYPHC